MNILQWWSLYCRCQIQGRSGGNFQFMGSAIGISAIALAAPIMSQSVWAATLSHWSYDPDSQEFQVTLPEGIEPRYFLMAEPARIVIDLPGVEVGAVPTQASYSGAIRQIRVAQFEAGLARVVIELAPDTVLEPRQAESRRSGDWWILRPLIAGSAATTPVAAQSDLPEGSESTASSTVPTPATTPNLPATATSTLPSSPNQNQPVSTLVPTPTADSAIANDASSAVAEPLADTPSAAVSVEDDLTAEIQGVAVPVNLPPEMTEAEAPAAVTVAPVETPLEANLPTAANSAPPTAIADATEAAVPIAITVPAPPPSPVTAETVEADAVDEPEEDVATIAAPTVGESEPEPLAAPPTANARVTVPNLPAVAATETAERTPAVATPQPSMQTFTASERSTAIAQQPGTVSNTSDLPAVTFPAPTLPSGNTQIRVPAPTTPQAQPVPAPAASLDTTEATGSAADLVLPATGISTQRPGGFSPLTQAPVSSTEVVRVPDLPPLPTVAPAAGAATANSENSTTAQVRNGAVTFGQPLPEQSPRPPVTTVDANVWLPANTVLKLQYPRDQELTLDPQVNWQEVLVLSHDVLHPQTGQVILPTGTQVVGRFETRRQGSRFIAQAVSVGDRNVKLAAESESIDGDRTISSQELLRNSGIGAAAATVIGGLSGVGLLAGVAAGAATTYITAPQPAVIQPYQMIEVRVLEDVTRSEIAQVQ